MIHAAVDGPFLPVAQKSPTQTVSIFCIVISTTTPIPASRYTGMLSMT